MPISNEDPEDVAEIQRATRAHADYLRTRENLGADNEFSEMLAALAQEVPEVPAHYAEALLDVLADRGWLSGGRRRGATRESAYVARVVKMLRYLKNHFNPNAFFALLHIWDDPLFDDINGNLSQTEFADRMYPSSKPVNPAKAAVNNAVKDAQRFFQTPPRQDQRSPAACATMSKKTIARLEQRGGARKTI